MYINNIYKGAEKVVTSGDDLQISWESKSAVSYTHLTLPTTSRV